MDGSGTGSSEKTSETAGISITKRLLFFAAATGCAEKGIICSHADYAIAMVDEIEKGDHIQQRISVVRE